MKLAMAFWTLPPGVRQRDACSGGAVAVDRARSRWRVLTDPIWVSAGHVTRGRTRLHFVRFQGRRIRVPKFATPQDCVYEDTGLNHVDTAARLPRRRYLLPAFDVPIAPLDPRDRTCCAASNFSLAF